ncbi:MAG: hypothetical protein V2G42_03500 [bacterium JZ-2024 1]
MGFRRGTHFSRCTTRSPLSLHALTGALAPKTNYASYAFQPNCSLSVGASISRRDFAGKDYRFLITVAKPF